VTSSKLSARADLLDVEQGTTAGRLPRLAAKVPITSSLSAGWMIVALPTLLIVFLLHKQFVPGLTLGATKG
jgi:ABC-type glycerol-3-phosphate transport system permease component